MGMQGKPTTGHMLLRCSTAGAAGPWLLGQCSAGTTAQHSAAAQAAGSPRKLQRLQPRLLAATLGSLAPGWELLWVVQQQ